MSPKIDDVSNYEAVIRIVRTWPTTQRMVLVQEVLNTLAPEASTAPRQPTLSRARGLLATGRPAPSDADVATMLDERQRERYGL